MSAVVAQLESIVGTAAVCAWDALPPEQRSQISSALVSEPQCIVYPQTQAELAEVLTCAYQNRWRVLPCGSGSKLHWGGLAEGVDLVVSTARLDRLVEHAVGDLTATAEAGIRFAELQATLATQGQFLAIDPSFTETATLGGIVATADTGSLRQRYGGIRDLLIGLSFVRADGQVAKAGGRVVKNVAGYDLMKLFTGSWGSLGVISQVTFRIYPLAEASQTVVLIGETAAIAKATQTLLASALTPIAADLVPPQAIADLNLGQGMGLIVQFGSIEVSVKQQVGRLMQVGEALDLKVACFLGQDEAALWSSLRQRTAAFAQPRSITCKIGVLPSKAVAILDKISALLLPLQAGSLHAGSGLGMLEFAAEAMTVDDLIKLRDLCNDGFLTILAAPRSLKQQLDIWGYSGNALPLMQNIKHQFDPKNLLSPGRFVGGI
jgi:glycolate oxidase FAD binding subunit